MPRLNAELEFKITHLFCGKFKLNFSYENIFQGDSGGPLQIFSSPAMGTVIGVVSFGISCGTSLPSIYTRVAYYMDWIESIVWPNSFKDSE